MFNDVGKGAESYLTWPVAHRSIEWSTNDSDIISRLGLRQTLDMRQMGEG